MDSRLGIGVWARPAPFRPLRASPHGGNPSPSSMLLADVAVPVPLSRAFTYEVPDDLAAELRPGARVLCPFGPRKLVGVVLGVTDDSERPELPRVRPIGAIL